MPFDYGGEVSKGRDDTEFVVTGAGHDISNADEERKGTENVVKQYGVGGSECGSSEKMDNVKTDQQKTTGHLESDEEEGGSESGEVTI